MYSHGFLRNMVATIFLMGSLIYLAGCVQLTQSEIKALETREMDCSFDEAYRAAANGLFTLGFIISHSDKASGILTGTRHDPNTGAKIGAALFFGVLGLAATEDRNDSVSFMLSELEPKLTQLRMKVNINGKSVVDRIFMTKIWQQIEREAMLDSRPSTAVPTSQPSTNSEITTSNGTG